MQFEYDPEKLIEEVKKRPGIWDYEHADYRAKNLRYKLWNEVVNELMQTDVKMSKSEMRELETQLKRKWKIIRDYFQRFRKKPHKRNKPHMYSNKLQFLLKNEGRTKTEHNSGAESSTKSDEGSKPEKTWKPKKKSRKTLKIEEVSSEEDDNETSDVEEVPRNSKDDNDARQVESGKMNKLYVIDAEFAFANVDSQSKIDADDPDRLFLLSLLPHLKSIPEEFRLNVKMELMQVLRTINNSMAKEHRLI